MKNIYFFIFFLILSSASFAQSEANKFFFGLVMPAADNNVTQSNIQKLENKIVQLVSNTNDATIQFSSDFMVCPQVTVNEFTKVEGGLQIMTVAKADLIINVIQVSTGKVFASLEKKISGSGDDKEQSVNNALSSISSSDQAYAQFISNSIIKITQYYNENCSDIMATATKLESKKDYAGAMSMLQSVPAGASCYSAAQAKCFKLFDKYENTVCKDNIRKAKAEIAKHNYDNALDLLQIVGPSSTCSSDANALMADISKKINVDRANAQSLEKLRINAVKEIASAYFSGKAKRKKD